MATASVRQQIVTRGPVDHARLAVDANWGSSAPRAATARAGTAHWRGFAASAARAKASALWAKRARLTFIAWAGCATVRERAARARQGPTLAISSMWPPVSDTTRRTAPAPMLRGLLRRCQGADWTRNHSAQAQWHHDVRLSRTWKSGVGSTGSSGVEPMRITTSS